MNRTVALYIGLTACAILAQGFQCASSDVAVAKKAMQQQDFSKAKASLEKALVANPKDCDALMLLGDVNDRLRDVEGMVDAYQKARSCEGIKPQQKEAISVTLYNQWVVSYNEGISTYNSYVETTDRAKLSAAMAALKRARNVKPEFPDPLPLMGQIAEVTGDTNAAIQHYTAYWNLEKPGADIMRSKGVAIGGTRGAMIKALGTPVTTKMDSIDNGVIYKDRFDIGGRDMITFAFAQGTADAEIEGWSYNPPATVTELEKWRVRTLSISPLKSLAFIAYSRGDNQQSLEWANAAMSVKPKDQDLVPLRTQVLQNLGKGDEAMSELKSQIDRDPSAVATRLQYAAMLSSSEKYADANQQYLKVLELDAKNETALYNLAANYKNIASDKQRNELLKMDKNKKYVPDTSYLGDLQTAASYFEQLRSASLKYRDDLIVLEQLANTYEVRKEPAKVKAVIMELEALEDRYRSNREYYRVMEGLYGRNKMMDKMKQAQEKGAKL